MFDIQKTGQYIAFLRKSRNMTQGQLAEKLGVSHQAVSNWERGEAMPDITLFTRLAKILNTTTDRILLSGENPMDESCQVVYDSPETRGAVAGHPADAAASEGSAEANNVMEQQNPACTSGPANSMKEKGNAIQDLQSTIKILTDKMQHTKSQPALDKLQELLGEVQDQIDTLQDEIDERQEEMDEEQAETDEEQAELDSSEELAGLENLRGLAGLRPEIARRVQQGLAQGFRPGGQDAMAHPGDCEGNSEDADRMSWNQVMAIAPFASADTLDSLISELEEKADFRKIVQLAPFLGSGTIERLVLEAYQGGGNPDWSTVMNLAPFTPCGTLDTLVASLEDKADFEKIRQLAPFLQSLTIERLVLSAFRNGDTSNWDIVTSLAPFASNETLDMLITKSDCRIDFNKIVELAPFLSAQTIDKLMRQRMPGKPVK